MQVALDLSPQEASQVDSGVKPRRSAIELRDVSKHYKDAGAPIVDKLTLSIAEGEFVALTGPSGCGKTTTLKMINRLIEPSSGQILINGLDVDDLPSHRLRQGIGYVIQNVGLFPHMTIAENVAAVPRLLGWKKDRTANRIDELLSMVGLEPSMYRDRYPRELSGGQAQRVGVARALAADPPILLMDEPFAAVDPITRTSLQDEFLRLQQSIRKTIVFVTHDMAEAMRLADRVVIFGPQSKIAQVGAPTEVLSAPADAFVSSMLGTGRLVQLLSCVKLRDVSLDPWPTISEEMGQDERLVALAEALGRGKDRVLVLDEAKRPRYWIYLDGNGESMRFELDCTLDLEVTSLRDAITQIVYCPHDCAVVVDGDESFQGVIDLKGIRRSLAPLAGSSASIIGVDK